MSELDRHRDELKVSQNEVSQLNRLLSSRDSLIRELRASKKLVSQELEIARRDIKVLEDDRGIMKALCDKSDGQGCSHRPDPDKEAWHRGA
jgi:hypothetical protein